jgi:uncharacterized protein (DUF1330 family)
MPGYVIAEVDVTDPTAFEEYRKQVPATVQKYGGTFLTRGGTVHPLEGGWQPKRLVILEFPSVEQAQRWYDSEEYRGPKALRMKASRGKLILVEGAPSA